MSEVRVISDAAHAKLAGVIEEWKMKPTNPYTNARRWWTGILTDIHFWVPLAVLAGGLLLLRLIR